MKNEIKATIHALVRWMRENDVAPPTVFMGAAYELGGMFPDDDDDDLEQSLDLLRTLIAGWMRKGRADAREEEAARRRP
jgi:hypothetical protein